MSPDFETYPTEIEAIIEAAAPCPLKPGRPNQTLKPSLQQLTPEAICQGQAVKNREMAEACISGLFLLHNFLELSHEISQDLPSSTGSYWHGIMHRREPDYSNAKYWFRKVGNHPIFLQLTAAASEEIQRIDLNIDVQLLTSDGQWDPFAFVDACEIANRGNKDLEVNLIQIAHLEWKLLFNYCFQQAIGK